MNKCFRAVLLSAGLIGLSACSTIIEGTEQTIAVDTEPRGASCDIYREGSVVHSIQSTPATIEVDRTKHDLTFVCNKPGYQEARYVNESDVEAMTAGNLLLGGLVGWAVDSSSGADNSYNETVLISLPPL